MILTDTSTRLLVENLIFWVAAISFFGITRWAWRHEKPYQLPTPLPDWFRVWFLSVQILGIVPPLVALILGGIIQKHSDVLAVFAAYFLMLGLQILSESLALRRFQSTVFVMVPYLYLPYRFWQLYEGLTLIAPAPDLAWVRWILVLELVVWIGNYALDVAQLPRLLQWGTQSHDSG